MRTAISDYQEMIKKAEETFFRIFLENLRRKFAWIQGQGLNLVVSMEGWNFRDNGKIEFLRENEEVSADRYETWISAFLYCNDQILCEKQSGELPSACVNLMKFSVQDRQSFLETDYQYIEKSENQIREILEEWKENPAGYRESKQYYKWMQARAKHYEVLFNRK